MQGEDKGWSCHLHVTFVCHLHVPLYPLSSSLLCPPTRQLIPAGDAQALLLSGFLHSSGGDTRNESRGTLWLSPLFLCLLSAWPGVSWWWLGDPTYCLPWAWHLSLLESAEPVLWPAQA